MPHVTWDKRCYMVKWKLVILCGAYHHRDDVLVISLTKCGLDDSDGIGRRECLLSWTFIRFFVQVLRLRQTLHKNISSHTKYPQRYHHMSCHTWHETRDAIWCREYLSFCVQHIIIEMMAIFLTKCGLDDSDGIGWREVWIWTFHELSWTHEIFRTSIEITPDAAKVDKFTY
jgi:hypothetical protein